LCRGNYRWHMSLFGIGVLGAATWLTSSNAGVAGLAIALPAVLAMMIFRGPAVASRQVRPILASLILACVFSGAVVVLPSLLDPHPGASTPAGWLEQATGREVDQGHVEREEFWRETRNILETRPISGDPARVDGRSLHNDGAQLVALYGASGLILVAALLAKSLFDAMRLGRRSLSATFVLVAVLASIPMWSTHSTLLGMNLLWVGMGFVVAANNSRPVAPARERNPIQQSTAHDRMASI
jgi:hypothetical protein